MIPSILICLWATVFCEARPLVRRERPRSPSSAVTRRIKSESSWTVDPHRIVAIEHSRLSRGRLEKWLFQGPSEQKGRVLLAMARIADPAFLEPINRLLNKSRESRLRAMAAFAMGSIESEAAYLLISQNAPMHKDSLLVAELLAAAGRTGDAKSISFLGQYLKPSLPPVIHEGACRGLGYAFARVGDQAVVSESMLMAIVSLTRLKTSALSAAFALARYAGDTRVIPVASIVSVLSQIPEGPVRALLYRTLGKVGSEVGGAALVQAVLSSQSQAERIEALKGLNVQKVSESVLAAYRKGLQDSSRHVQVSALESMAVLGEPAQPLVAEIDALLSGSGSEWVRSHALIALAHIHPTMARTRISQLLQKSSGMLLSSAVYCFAILGTPQDLMATKEFLASPHLRLVQRALESLLMVESALVSEETRKASIAALSHNDLGIVAMVADLVARHAWKSHLSELIGAYGGLKDDSTLEGRTAIVRAVGLVGDEAHVEFLQMALKDTQRVVAEAASKSLKRITGKDFPFALNGQTSSPLPSALELKDALRRKIEIHTSRGDFSIRFLEGVPMTAYYFVKHAREFKGRTFHRIVPNFVVQGGDPRGDGYGGARYTIRDEISSHDHDRGIVGIATSGKDTGSYQFFVNTAPNLHLVGKYTAFAQVESGLDVLDRLEPTDSILQVDIH